MVIPLSVKQTVLGLDDFLISFRFITVINMCGTRCYSTLLGIIPVLLLPCNANAASIRISSARPTIAFLSSSLGGRCLVQRLIV